MTLLLSTNVRIPSAATVRSNSANASASLANRSSQTMDVLAALITSKDHSISCSSRMIDTSAVTPSFVTVRESAELTILGSRSIIYRLHVRGCSMRRSRRFLDTCQAAAVRGYVRGVEELANAPEEADPRLD